MKSVTISFLLKVVAFVIILQQILKYYYAQ